jgi:hypothetical protein
MGFPLIPKVVIFNPALVILSLTTLSFSDGTRLSDRDRLLSLLHDSSLLGDVPIGRSSFVEADSTFGHFLASSGGSSSDSTPRRRVSPHVACECPEQSDTMSDDCIRKRLDLVENAYHAITDAGGPELTRRELRGAFRDMVVNYERVMNTTDTLHKLIYDGLDGGKSYLASVQEAAGAVKLVAEAMARCVNMHWSQEFSLDDISVEAIHNANALLIDTVRHIVQWFNDLQRREEQLSYDNLLRVVNITNTDIQSLAKKINLGMASLKYQMSSLEESMDSSEKQSEGLLSSLEATADGIGDQIQSLVDHANKNLDTARLRLDQTEYPKRVSDFQKHVDQVISQMMKQVHGKLVGLSNSTNTQIEGQMKAMRDSVLVSAKDELKSKIVAANQKHRYFKVNATAIESSLTSIISQMLNDRLNQINRAVNLDRSALDIQTQSFLSISGTFQSLQSDIAKRLAESQTSLTTIETKINGDVERILSDLSSKNMKRVIDSANGFAATALSSIDTTIRSQISSMEQQLYDSMTDISTQTQSSAVKSKRIENGMSISLTQLSNAIDEKSEQIGSKVRTSFSQLLVDIFNVLPPELLSDRGVPPEELTKLMNEISGNITDKVVLNSSLSSMGSIDMNTKTQQLIASYLKTLGQGSVNATDKISQNRLMIASNSRKQSDVLGASIDAERRYELRLGDASNSLGSVEDGMADMFGDFKRKLVSTNDINEREFSLPNLNRINSDIDSIRTKFNKAQDQQHSSIVEATDSEERSKTILKQDGRSATTLSQISRDRVSAATEESLSQVSESASRLAMSRSGKTMDIWRQLSRVESNFKLKAEEWGIGNLEKVRITGQGTQQAGTRINDWLRSQTGNIYKLYPSLITTGQAHSVWDSSARAKIARAVNSSLEFKRTARVQVKELKNTTDVLTRSSLLVLDQLREDLMSSVSRIPLNLNRSIAQAMGEYATMTGDVATKLAQAQAELNRTDLKSPFIEQGSNVLVAIESVRSNFSKIPKSLNLSSDTFQTKTINLIHAGENLLLNQSDSIVFMQDLADQVSKNASILSRNASSILDQFILSVETATNKSAAKTDLQLAIRSNQITSNHKMVERIQHDLDNTINDYKAQVTATLAVQNNRPELLYNEVVKNRAETASIIAKMASSVARSGDQLHERIDTNTTMGQAIMSATKAQIVNLIEVFRKTFESEIQLRQGRYLFDQASELIIENVTRTINQLDYELQQGNVWILNQIREALSQVKRLRDSYAQIESKTNRTMTSFASWEQRTHDSVSSLLKDVKNISMTLPNVQTVLDSEINSLVNIIEANLIPTISEKSGQDLRAKLETLRTSIGESSPTK